MTKNYIKWVFVITRIKDIKKRIAKMVRKCWKQKIDFVLSLLKIFFYLNSKKKFSNVKFTILFTVIIFTKKWKKTWLMKMGGYDMDWLLMTQMLISNRELKATEKPH